MKAKTKKQKKVKKVFKEFGEGKLHSGSKEGPVVTNRKQATAIALSEAGASKIKKKHPKMSSKIAKRSIDRLYVPSA